MRISAGTFSCAFFLISTLLTGCTDSDRLVLETQSVVHGSSFEGIPYALPVGYVEIEVSFKPSDKGGGSGNGGSDTAQSKTLEGIAKSTTNIEASVQAIQKGKGPPPFKKSDAPVTDARTNSVASAAATGNTPSTLDQKDSNQGGGGGSFAAQTAQYSVKISAPAFMPDPHHHYYLRVNHNSFYNDQTAINTDAYGLLAAINAQPEDQTGKIIQTLAEAPGGILRAVTPASNGNLVDDKKPIEFDFKGTVNPLDSTSVEGFNKLFLNRKKFCLVARRLTGVPTAIPKTTPTHTAQAPLDCSSAACFRPLVPVVIAVISDVTPVQCATLTNGGMTALKDSSSDYTQERERQFAAVEPALANTQILAQTVVVVPDTDTIGRLVFDRGFLISKTIKATFNRGTLTSINLDNPSEVLASVELPINVAKAIVGIPSAMLHFKITNVNNDTTFLAAQQKNLDAQTNLLNSQNAYLTALASQQL